MLNIPRQIDYWHKGADSDIETAEILLKTGKLRESLFFCHLTIEKILKALAVKQINDIPPRSHDLEYLANKAEVKLENEQLELMRILMLYQLEGRYPGDRPIIKSKKVAEIYFTKTKELLICLKKML